MKSLWLMKIQTTSCYLQSAIFEQCATTCKQRNPRGLIGRNGGKLTSASGALFWSWMCAMIFQGMYANELCSDWLQTQVTLCILAVAYICILPQNWGDLCLYQVSILMLEWPPSMGIWTTNVPHQASWLMALT